MTLKTKLLLALCAVVFLATLGSAVGLVLSELTAQEAVLQDAEREAGILATFPSNIVSRADLSEPERLTRLQEYASIQHRTLNADVVVTDRARRILADAIPANVGSRFEHDPGNEVAATIADRRARTFIERSIDYPEGIDRIVVAMVGAQGAVAGALIYEYTRLKDQVQRDNARRRAGLAIGTLIALLAALGLGMALARGMIRRIGVLGAAVRSGAAGNLAQHVPYLGNDELGMLGAETNTMFDNLREAAANRERASATQRAAETRLQHLLGASPAVVYSARVSGDYGATFISENIRGQLGYAPEDFLDDAGFWANHIHPEDRERILADLPALLEAGEHAHEYRFRHRDGSWRWMRDEMMVVRDGAGAPQELVGSWIDITARKQLEVSLLRRDTILNAVAYGAARFLHASGETSDAEWNLIVEAVLAHLGEATGASRVWVFENEQSPTGAAGARPIHRWALPQYTVADATLRAALNVVYERDGLGVEALRLRRGEVLQLRVGEQPQPWRGIMEHLGVRSAALAPITAGGEWWGILSVDDCAEDRRWIPAELEALRAAADLFGAAIAGRAGRAELRASMETLGSVLEKLKRQSAEISRQNTELAQASRMKSEFMNNVTHELRTPLNAVIGFAELLQDQVPGPLNARQAEFVGDIVGSGERLLALVEGILEMSRLDAADTALEREAVEVGAALEERVDAQRRAAEARGVTMTLELVPDAGSAALDPKALRRMLDALLDNAIKFNREGGAVTVSARRDGDWLEIAVADSGIGIAPADLPKLFQPLVQLDAGLDRRQGGIGLGLALARRLAELHGGTIEVISEPGKGSTFTLRLPLQEKS